MINFDLPFFKWFLFPIFQTVSVTNKPVDGGRTGRIAVGKRIMVICGNKPVAISNWIFTYVKKRRRDCSIDSIIGRNPPLYVIIRCFRQITISKRTIAIGWNKPVDIGKMIFTYSANRPCDFSINSNSWRNPPCCRTIMTFVFFFICNILKQCKWENNKHVVIKINMNSQTSNTKLKH